ncbi:MAG: hypothetical protein ABSH38_13895 [Verrucomicrobiota bacterium]
MQKLEDQGLNNRQNMRRRFFSFVMLAALPHVLFSSSRLAAASGSTPGSKAGTRSNGYDPVKSDFIHASHPERKYIVD